MQTLKSFLDQSLLIWKDSTAAARIGLALLLILCVGTVVGVGIWSSQPHYINLASDLSPEQAAKIIDELDSAGISYQVKGSGSIIMVDKREWSRAQIAAGKLGIKQMESNFEDVSPWMDPLNQQNVFRRNLERQLEHSLARLEFVESADIHLSIPEKQAFIRQRNSPTASVMLEMVPGVQIGEDQASSIAALVANAVSGLTPDQVSITDTAGNVYATDATLGQLTKQEEYRVMRERQLSQKAEMILTRFLGIGNASVAVTTDFTFPEGTTTTTEFDPDNKVVVDETIKNMTSTNEGTPAIGTAGIASNGVNATPPNAKVVVSKTEDLTSKYEVSKTSRVETMNTPILNFMSVSVLINSEAQTADGEPINATGLEQKVKDLVSQAVGLRDGKDLITVEAMPFVEPVPLADPTTTLMPWDKLNTLLKNLSLGLAAVVALFVGLKTLRKIQPDPVSTPDAADRGTQADQLSELVKQNPEVFSKIIASWSSQELPERESQQSKAA